MTKPAGGIAYLKADGQQFALRGNLNVGVPDVERESIVGQDGVHGYVEKPVAPYIEGDLTDSGGLSVEQIAAIRDATVTAELVNGKVYVLREAWVTTAIAINTAEGSMNVRFEGMRMEEITV